ncbi:MAG: hypothetical protein O7G86_07725, partial [Gammaproteobacteria bacterium]|nr:hypothetical protein [Gammaproteobacteria bacterium]
MSCFVRCFARLTLTVIGFSVAATAIAQDSFAQRINSLIFGEIDYREREDQGDDGFVIGQGVAQFNIRLDDRLSVFTELTATARKDQSFDFSVERLFVRYDFSDHYKLSAGRYHTPLGYWNSSFHHGSWLQTTVSRPQTVKFGSNVVPIHFVGALLEGNIGDSDFGYKVGYGNGRSDKINAPGDVGDSNNSRAWMIAGHYRPPGRIGLHTGFSLYVDEINREFEPEIDELLFSAYLALEREAPEVVVEYTYANHDSSLSEGNVHSIYGQVAYRLTGNADKFKPYIRVERLDVDDDDPLLGTLDLDYEGVIAGTRWDFSPSAVLKAEIRHEEFGNTGSRNSFWLQLAFVFNASSGNRPYVARAPQYRV